MLTLYKVISLCVLVLLFCSAVVNAEMIAAGTKVPEFDLQDSDGRNVSSEDLLGSPVMLAYLRLDQDDSKLLLQDCVEWSNEFADLKIFLIVDKPITEFDDYSFPLLIDEKREVYGSWGVRVFPSIILADETGVISYSRAGFSKLVKGEIKQEMEVLLGIKTIDEVKDAGLEYTIDKSAEGSAIRHYQAGKKLWDDGLLDKAAIEWQEAIKEDENYFDARFYLARYYYRMGNSREARLQLEAVDEAFSNADALGLMARCLIDEDDLVGAEKLIEKALDINRRSFEAKLTLAEICLLKGDLLEADAYIEEVLLFKSQDARALYLKGRLAEFNNDLPRAVEFYRQSIEQFIDDF